MINITTVKRIAYVYLLIPFILFIFGWLNIIAAVIVFLIIIGGLVFGWQSMPAEEGMEFKKSDFISLVVVLGVWLLLSGVGGYSFQNWDHHSRNAVFRDLINYPWPVLYHLDPAIANQFGVQPVVILSYYFGFWLPSALVGKLLGWGVANFSLFMWTYLGIVLSIVLTALKLRLSFLKAALLVIFFSGMDFVGVLLLQNVPGYTYPHLWPPIQHLEWWAGSLQYSSFTTELYWTYNQFVPALLIMSLLVTASNIKKDVFLAGLCFFFAPLPALGMLPFVGGRLIDEIYKLISDKLPRSWTGIILQRVFTIENLTGVMIGSIALLFFSTNLSAQSRSFGLPASPAVYVLFLLLEWLLMWFLLLPGNKNDWTWYVAGFFLVFAPFVNFGGSWDFMMRTTIPALYILMLGCARFLETNKSVIPRAVILGFLFLGALTPIYEINRSIVRTVRYDFPSLSPFVFDQYFKHPPSIAQSFVPEFDHPNTLTADEWISVSIPGPEGWTTKVGNLFSPPFRFLLKEDLICDNQIGPGVLSQCTP